MAKPRTFQITERLTYVQLGMLTIVIGSAIMLLADYKLRNLVSLPTAIPIFVFHALIENEFKGSPYFALGVAQTYCLEFITLCTLLFALKKGNLLFIRVMAILLLALRIPLFKRLPLRISDLLYCHQPLPDALGELHCYFNYSNVLFACFLFISSVITAACLFLKPVKHYIRARFDG